MALSFSKEVKAEKWSYIIFVHRTDRGGQFISYCKLVMWLQVMVKLIEACTNLKQLQQIGTWIRQECQKLPYYESLIDYLRQVWVNQREKLKLS